MVAEFRHGFKSEAERIAEHVRRDLGLEPTDRLDCFALADAWGIPVVSLGELREDGASEASIRRLMSPDAGFSATTVVVGPRRLVVYNPRHEAGRKASSLAHELAHVILEHEAAPAIGVGGCRHWDGRQEAEADWLGSALLVPRAGALAWMLENDDIDAGASNFGVSVELFRWRINHTGVVRQVEKLKRRARVAP
ncbi:MAG TPA: ImmA/IrrE family metallo-endopeptidase [Gaiellaceae bacterium]|nr:ImmA/IrrE family metallo-endopeptidase [Gaiellaceae bacterium]